MVILGISKKVWTSGPHWLAVWIGELRVRYINKKCSIEDFLSVNELN